jgi:hypothetical protein
MGSWRVFSLAAETNRRVFGARTPLGHLNWLAHIKKAAFGIMDAVQELWFLVYFTLPNHSIWLPDSH